MSSDAANLMLVEAMRGTIVDALGVITAGECRRDALAY
jgi:hypothetical protein